MRERRVMAERERQILLFLVDLAWGLCTLALPPKEIQRGDFFVETCGPSLPFPCSSWNEAWPNLLKRCIPVGRLASVSW